jgi:hypothetical protein
MSNHSQVPTETVLATKEFLDLAKCKSWEKADKSVTLLFPSEKHFNATKEFLDTEIAKHDDWANVDKSVNIKSLFASNRQFQQCKKFGVGCETIE